MGSGPAMIGEVIKDQRQVKKKWLGLLCLGMLGLDAGSTSSSFVGLFACFLTHEMQS
jgi:hypothetical protein